MQLLAQRQSFNNRLSRMWRSDCSTRRKQQQQVLEYAKGTAVQESMRLLNSNSLSNSPSIRHPHYQDAQHITAHKPMRQAYE